MHVTTVFQITEDSLMDNSCMSIQSETQLRSDGGTMYYKLQEYSIVDISYMQKEFIPWRLRSYFSLVSVMRPIHIGGVIGPQEKLCKEIGGLEG